MKNITLALDLEGTLITNAVSQFPRPGLMIFLNQCYELFGQENLCIYTSVDECRFRDVAKRLVINGVAPEWFVGVRYIEWVGEHKDLRFIDDNIENVIIIDDYPPYVKGTQKHRLITIKEYLDPYTHESPDLNDSELEAVFDLIKTML